MEALISPHWNTITPNIRDLLTFIGQQPFSERFYLAGGTALALRLGHRPSHDLDFFSATDEVHDRTRHEIVQAFAKQGGQVIENVDGNLLLLGQGIHLGFFSYGYSLMAPLESVENVGVAGLLDIGLMKLDALIGRGSRKDFYDVYQVSQHISWADLLNAAGKKYPHTRDFGMMVIESLIQFDNADRDVQPELFIGLSWEQVKAYFTQQAHLLGREWFG
jgi:hypothetical protein